MRLLLFIFIFVDVVGAIYEPENAIHCANIQDMKEAIQCRKNHAGGLQCRDKTRCTIESGDLKTMQIIEPFTGIDLDILYCPDDAVSYRTGHQCNDYPYYMGGYPMSRISWDDEWEAYNCVRNISSYCHEWEIFEYSPSEYELGTFTCRETAISSLGYIYCLKFTSVQRESEYCDSATVTCSPNCNRPTYCNKICYTENGYYDCSYVPHSEYEYTRATVLAVNEYGAWLQWTQEEYDEFNYKFKEYENYKCTGLSANKRYCHSWIGDIDSEEEFEISSCTCIDETDSLSSFCKKWICYETGMSYFFPSLPWVLLGIFPSLFLLYFYNDAKDMNILHKLFLCSMYSIPAAALSIAVVFLGGIPAWTIWFCLHVLISLIVFPCYRCSLVKDCRAPSYRAVELPAVELPSVEHYPNLVALEEASAPTLSKDDDLRSATGTENHFSTRNNIAVPPVLQATEISYIAVPPVRQATAISYIEVPVPEATAIS